jgi:hypothetical protein
MRVLNKGETEASLEAMEELDEHAEFLGKDELKELKEAKEKAQQRQSSMEGFSDKWRSQAKLVLILF